MGVAAKEMAFGRQGPVGGMGPDGGLCVCVCARRTRE